MIGLLDYDLITSNSTRYLIPNLEIMKLASYYKVEENKFCRLLTLDEQELSNYDKIYFFSELAGRPQIPEAYLRANNVIYGGTSFTNGKYVPFENEIIDYTLPRTFIYKEFFKQKYSDGVKASAISHALDDTYYRNYAGNLKLPLPSILARKRVYLYDREFFYDDWQETMQIITNRSPSTIIRLHPVICHTLTEYFALRAQPKLARTTDIILDLNIPLTEVHYMLKKYKSLFLADIVQSSNVYITIGDSLPTQMQYFRDFIYKLNLLFSFWSYGILLKIRYKEPKIGFQNPIENLEQLVDSTFNIEIKERQDFTLNQKIPPKKKNNKKNILEDEKQLLLKFHPSAADLFDQSFNKIYSQGRWRI